MAVATLIFPDDSLKESFAQAQVQKNKRWIKCEIENEKIVEKDSAPPSNSVIDDFESIRKFFEEFEACYILFRLDMNDPNSWILIRFIHERSLVRKRMLYSSSSENVKRSLGMACFKFNFFGVEKDSMTLTRFVEDNLSLLTDSIKNELASIVSTITSDIIEDEKERERIRKLQNEVHEEIYSTEERAKRAEARMEVHTGGSSTLDYPVDDSVDAALMKMKEGKLNFIELSLINERLTATRETDCAVSSVCSAVDSKLPHFYVFPAPAEMVGKSGAYVFVYSCPTGCPVRSPRVRPSATHSTSSFARSSFRPSVKIPLKSSPSPSPSPSSSSSSSSSSAVAEQKETETEEKPKEETKEEIKEEVKEENEEQTPAKENEEEQMIQTEEGNAEQEKLQEETDPLSE
eukprot:MONOS_1755.1-p1 / transcript=MONOS_1755.1 / gene=MONOS_1755 / organism=Monocercomonoides_exilis_PA203 / gene_product=cofilin/ADF / transcript_product=cofilin/ADF / location=Mono_scaffold00032:155894-159235(+) / protein_length=403 / sequence_SO=supercontig / SO=protein_coding / is_pseudo=false